MIPCQLAKKRTGVKDIRNLPSSGLWEGGAGSNDLPPGSHPALLQSKSGVPWGRRGGSRRGVVVAPCLSAPIPGGIWLGSGRPLRQQSADRQGFGPRLSVSIFVVPWTSPEGDDEWLTGIFS